MCDTSGHSQPLSAGRPTRRRRKTCASFNCIRRRSECSRRASGLGAALLLHSDAGPAGSGAPAHRRAAAAADTGGAQRRGGDAAAAGGIVSEVQGGVRHRRSLSSGRPKAGPVGRWAARLGGCRAQSRRCRFRAHAAARRARQGAQSRAFCEPLVHLLADVFRPRPIVQRELCYNPL